MTAHSVLNVRAAPEWGNSELYKYYERNGLGYGTVHHQQKVDSVELEADEIPELIDQDTGEKGETNIEHYI